jgi:hypothetical protein
LECVPIPQIPIILYFAVKRRLGAAPAAGWADNTVTKQIPDAKTSQTVRPISPIRRNYHDDTTRTTKNSLASSYFRYVVFVVVIGVIRVLFYQMNSNPR